MYRLNAAVLYPKLFTTFSLNEMKTDLIGADETEKESSYVFQIAFNERGD